jgi:hypothetical protein
MGDVEALVEPLEDEKRPSGLGRACLHVAATLLRLVHRRVVGVGRGAVGRGLVGARFLTLSSGLAVPESEDCSCSRG